METYPDEEKTEDVILENKREGGLWGNNSKFEDEGCLHGRETVTNQGWV